MRTILSRLVLTAALCALTLRAPADANKPWELRNQYKIPIEKGVLVYAEDTAEWRVLLDGGQVLADRIGFTVVLEDGTELKGIGLGDGVSDRERLSDEFGEGTVYSVTFKPKNGLRIVHSLKTYKNRPFVFIDISVENVGQSDVKIAAIHPVTAEKSVMQSLSKQATVRHRRILDTGGQPVATPGKDATMAVIHDPSKPICFGVGLIPQGLARSTVTFKETAGTWKGDITCNYEPYKLLKAGAKLDSDPLWISHGVPDPDRVDLNYSWVYSTLIKVAPRPFDARGWYTLNSDQGLDAYVAGASDWKSAGIDHVLIGRGWEGRPGSMEGASGRFPENMKEAVGALSKAGMKVGVTIDPLASKGDGAGTAKSADGLSWLNPTSPESKEALTEKVKSLKNWNATFIAVDYSAIPDDVLAGFGVTRAEAQNMAYKSLREIADPLPVFPSSISNVTDGVDGWLDAGSAVAWMAVYGMTPGPLCCNLDENAQITPDLMTASQFWPGPIEFNGTLNKKIQGDVKKMLELDRVAAQPVDAALDAPRTWRFQRHDDTGAVVEDRTISVGAGSATTTAAPDVTTPAPEASKPAEPVKPAKETKPAKQAKAAPATTPKPDTEAKKPAAPEPKIAEATPEVKKAEATAPEKVNAEKTPTGKAEAEKGEAEKPKEEKAEAPVAKEETAKAETSDDGDKSFKKKLKRVWPF